MASPKPSFECDNLSLAVLSSCVSARLIVAPDYRAIKKAHPYADDVDTYNEMNNGVVHELVNALSPHGEAVAALEKLSWWPHWDGESTYTYAPLR